MSVHRSFPTIDVLTIKATQMLEAICWYKISDLFLYLADYALQERFVAFAVTTK